jgi:hypothetical protein
MTKKLSLINILSTSALLIFITIFTNLSYSEDINPATLTPQEANVLTALKKQFNTVMGREPTEEEQKKMLDQWRANMMNTMAKIGAIQSMAQNPSATVTQSAPSVLQAVPPITNTQAVNQNQNVAVTSSSQVINQSPTPAYTNQSLDQKTRESDFLKTISSNNPLKPLEIVGLRDGIRINNVNFVDPEGKMTAYSYDVTTGDITYQIAAPSKNSFVFKYFNPGKQVDPIVIATAQTSGNGLQVTTSSGAVMSGQGVAPMSKGIIVYRGNTLFVYEAGVGVKSSGIPDGWFVAQFQRGNVGATRHILIQNLSALTNMRDKGGIGGFIGSTMALASSLGISKKEDFALLNIDDGSMVKFDISVEGTSQMILTNCQKRNSYFNECAEVIPPQVN